MSKLTVINQNGQLVIDSREVAQKVDKQHAHLLRDIQGYLETLGKSNFGLADFFVLSSYIDVQGKERPCYLLTKKGCDMVANKMTGEKGVLFTAAYVTKFEEMEKQIQAPMQELSPQLQLLINMELEQKKIHKELQETKAEVQAIRDVIVINPQAEWRKRTNKILNEIGLRLNGNYKQVRDEVYEALKQRGNCRPNILVNNLKSRALMNGMSRSKADELNILDVLENEPRLREIYVTIVKEMAIKNGVWIREGQA